MELIMSQDLHNVDREIYNEYYNAIRRHIPWLKKMIKISGMNQYNIVIYEIYDYFGVNFIGKNPGIYEIVKDILLEEGIITSFGSKEDGTKIFTFSNIQIPMVNMPGLEEIKKFHNFLKENRLYDDKKRYLICPRCYHYSVKFSKNSYANNSSWWCDYCLDDIIYYGYNLEISDKDRYHIYKLWGADALSVLINENLKKTIRFVASYFKESCVVKKDKCLYFDFFRDSRE
jgi:hypothetical protein